MTQNTALNNHRGQRRYTHLFDTYEPRLGWHVLWTRSNCERMVEEQLLKKGYDVFLPLLETEGRAPAPMFKGYLFLHHAVDKHDFLRISKTRGLVTILGARWDRLAYVPDREVEAVQATVRSRLKAAPYPFLQEGDRVRFARGSLANAEGILVRKDDGKDLFVISVNLLRRSIAVEVDCRDVIPVQMDDHQ